MQEIFEMHTLPLHVSRHKFGWEHFYAKNYKLLKGEALVLQEHTKDAKASKRDVLKSVCTVISKWKHFCTSRVVPSPEVTDHFLSAF